MLVANNVGSCVRDAEGVRQWLSHKIIIDQRSASPNLCNSQPYGDVFGPVVHKEGNCVPLLDPNVERPVGNW